MQVILGQAKSDVKADLNRNDAANKVYTTIVHRLLPGVHRHNQMNYAFNVFVRSYKNVELNHKEPTVSLGKKR